MSALLGFLIVTGMCLAVLLTTGRVAASEQQVIGSIDSVGTRSIVVRATPDSGLDANVLPRVSRLASVQWVGAFSPTIDARNSSLTGGQSVAIRTLYSNDFGPLGLHTVPDDRNEGAYASIQALRDLGMIVPAGGLVAIQSGIDYPIVGQLTTPRFLGFLEPVVLIPNERPVGTEPVSVLVVIVKQPGEVATVTSTVQSLLGLSDPSKATVSTSAALAHLRSLVEAELTNSARGLVLLVLSAAAVLVAAVQYALVTMRRKDYGRRRALGATRTLIVTLVCLQTAIVSLVGAIAGIFIALAILAASHEPFPPTSFTVATGLAAFLAAMCAGIVPAIVASQRDPVRELRVP